MCLRLCFEVWVPGRAPLPQVGEMKVTMLCTSPEYLRRAKGVRRPAGTSLLATSAVAEVAAPSADVFCLGIMLARIFAGGARAFNREDEVCARERVCHPAPCVR